jgi:acyl-CoA synthetase (NDP forming)
VTSSGGSGILASDACEEANLELAKLLPSTVERLRKRLPEWCIINNPLDLTGNALSYPNHYADVLDEIYRDGSVDIVLLIYGDPIQGSFKAVQASLDKAKSTGLPVSVCYLGGAEVQVEEVNKFQEYGVPVFDEPSKAIVALGYLNQHRVNLSRIKQ